LFSFEIWNEKYFIKFINFFVFLFFYVILDSIDDCSEFVCGLPTKSSLVEIESMFSTFGKILICLMNKHGCDAPIEEK
jgi:hypothetical protein